MIRRDLFGLQFDENASSVSVEMLKTIPTSAKIPRNLLFLLWRTVRDGSLVKYSGRFMAAWMMMMTYSWKEYQF